MKQTPNKCVCLFVRLWYFFFTESAGQVACVCNRNLNKCMCLCTVRLKKCGSTFATSVGQQYKQSKLLLIIIIIPLLISAFISLFLDQFLRRRAEALKPAANGCYLMWKSLPYYDMYCTEVHVSFCNYMNENVENLKMQVNGPVPNTQTKITTLATATAATVPLISATEIRSNLDDVSSADSSAKIQGQHICINTGRRPSPTPTQITQAGEGGRADTSLQCIPS